MANLSNRILKFRAWDKKQRKMYSWEHMTTGYLIGFLTGYYKDTYIMQYTGLKDKNGKEIYEGDVLHCDGFWNLYAVWDEENARFAFLCTDWVVTQGHPIQPHISNHCIIGNIYENPELLGGD